MLSYLFYMQHTMEQVNVLIYKYKKKTFEAINIIPFIYSSYLFLFLKHFIALNFMWQWFLPEKDIQI